MCPTDTTVATLWGDTTADRGHAAANRAGSVSLVNTPYRSNKRRATAPEGSVSHAQSAYIIREI